MYFFLLLIIGFCVKAQRVPNNEKCFINICISDGIPSPEDITAEQLTEILASETPSTYKIPMSITELRLTPDKSGNDAVVCDVAIHPDFFRKIESVNIFRDFLITIIFEALDTKYNVQINRDTWIILKNRKSMGTLVKHRVQNRDVKKVYESYQNPTKEHKTLLNELKSDETPQPKKNLITELNSTTAKSIEKGKGSLTPTKTSDLPNTPLLPLSKGDRAVDNRTRTPEYCLHRSKNSLICEFFMPEVMQQDEIMLDLGRDRLTLEARRSGYLLDSFFPCDIDADRSNAEFDDGLHVSFHQKSVNFE